MPARRTNSGARGSSKQGYRYKYEKGHSEHESPQEGGEAPGAAHDPARNMHRSQAGWQAATVHTILKNGRYTGYEFWGRFEKSEELYQLDDPSFGYRTRLRRADESKLVN